MIDLALAAAGLALLVLPADLLLRAADRQDRLGRLERFGLALAFGPGFMAWWMTLLGLAGCPFSLPLLAAPIIVATPAALWWRPLRSQEPGNSDPRPPAAPETRRHGPRPARDPFGTVELALVAGMALVVLRVFLAAVTMPMEVYDAVAIWGLKAKAIVVAGRLPVSFLQDHGFAWMHADYPLLLPLVEGYLGLLMGSWNDCAAKLCLPVFLVALLILIHAALGRMIVRGPAGATLDLSRLQRLLFTFLLATIPALGEQASSGYADICIALFSAVGTIELFLWLQGGPDILLVAAGILAGLGATSKNEGMLFGLLDGALLTLVCVRPALMPRGRRVRPLQVAGFAAVVGAIAGPWLVIRWRLGLSNDVVNLANLGAALVGERLTRFLPVAHGLLHEAARVKTWNLAGALFLAAAAIELLRRPRRDRALLAAMVFAALAGYAGIYVASPYDPIWHMDRSLDRIVLHTLPIVIAVLAGAYREGRR